MFNLIWFVAIISILILTYLAYGVYKFRKATYSKCHKCEYYPSSLMCENCDNDSNFLQKTDIKDAYNIDSEGFNGDE